MYRSTTLAIVILASCTTPEREASSLALQYASLDLGDVQGSRALACSDEKAAKSETDMTASLETAKSVLGAKWDEMVARQKSAQHIVIKTTMNADNKSSDVEILTKETPDGGETVNEEPTTIKVRKEGDRWCVVTGWAEDKRLDTITSEGVAFLTQASSLLADWSLDEAEAAISQAEVKLASLPADRPARANLESSIVGHRELLALKRAGWAGGRWRVTEETDPMTDDKNVTIILQSVSGLPNVIGETKPASVIARCKRGKLDLFISTDSMLDYNWQSDSVTGQHRFGSDPPERISGSASTDRQAMFLKNPRAWLDQIRSHEDQDWTIELPLYGRTPASVKFNLKASGKALDSVPADCK